jgi:N-terminal acetyltransferase B complex catalytic subunit
VLWDIVRNQGISDKVMGKAEGDGEEWHGHVTAVTVAPEFRKIGMARRLMDLLEFTTDKV